ERVLGESDYMAAPATLEAFIAQYKAATPPPAAAAPVESPRMTRPTAVPPPAPAPVAVQPAPVVAQPAPVVAPPPAVSQAAAPVAPIYVPPPPAPAPLAAAAAAAPAQSTQSPSGARQVVATPAPPQVRPSVRKEVAVPSAIEYPAAHYE